MNAYTTEGWGELFLADAGASAALAGLLFVAVSINLDRIIALRGLPGAALGAIALLVAVLLVSTFGLVPGQPRWLLAGEVLVVVGEDQRGAVVRGPLGGEDVELDHVDAGQCAEHPWRLD